MSYECPKCHHKFNYQSVHCENWRDKEKSFGCPNCKQFFYKVQVGKVEYKQFFIAFFWSCASFALLFFLLPEVWWKQALFQIIPILIFSILATRAGRNIKLDLIPVSEKTEI